MTRADLKHCGKIPDAREELNRSVREGRIESRHSIKSLEGMGSRSHDLAAELRMHSAYHDNVDVTSKMAVECKVRIFHKKQVCQTLNTVGSRSLTNTLTSIPSALPAFPDNPAANFCSSFPDTDA